MKRRILALLAAASLVLCTLSGCGGRRTTAEEARSGVVRVAKFVTLDIYTVENGSLGQLVDSVQNLLASTGTAFGVGRAGQPTDVFVTNNHVVADNVIVLQRDANGRPTVAGAATVTAVYILLDNFAYGSETGLDPSRAVPCSVICSEDESGADIAILRAAEPVEGRIALALQKEESNLGINDTVTALGYPGSSDTATSEGAKLAQVEDVTVTAGTVSRFFDPSSVGGNQGQLDNSRYIQHTAVTNHGNSGGPLLDENGAVVGVNTQIVQDEDYAESTAFYALRIQYAKDALDDLGIAYDVYSPGPSPVLLIAAAVIAAAALAVILVLVLRKKPAPKPDTGTGPGPAPAPELRIQGQSGVFAGRRFAVNGQVRIGRDPGANDLVYPDGTPGISGHHCVVALTGGQLTLTDLGSSYGTFLANGQKLVPNQSVTLRPGDRFSLGSEKESFVITGKGGSLT